MARCFVALMLSVAALPAFAQQHDTATGRRIAEQDCARCHGISGDQQSPVERAAPFARIANMASTNELSLRVFLRTSHAGMPNLIFKDDELESLIAYILSQKVAK